MRAPEMASIFGLRGLLGEGVKNRTDRDTYQNMIGDLEFSIRLHT